MTTFSSAKWLAWTESQGIPWPRLKEGGPALDKDTFKDWAGAYPAVEPYRQLRKTLPLLREWKLAAGSDGRARSAVQPFWTRPGRNNPSNSQFIFALAKWFRSLIKPKPGFAVAYLDYEQQEFAISAVLSNDHAMLEAYASGDPYLMFAKQAKAVPPDATKESHKRARDLFKTCALAALYGIGPDALARRIGQPTAMGRELLRYHHETFEKFWQWSDNIEMLADARRKLTTVFDWALYVASDDFNPRTLRNFPVQAHGAEILRLAACLLTETGITTCALVHDAVLIEAPLDQIDATVAQTRELMVEAGRVVLGGFKLRVETKVVRHPDRFTDEAGAAMWAQVEAILRALAETPRAVEVPSA